MNKVTWLAAVAAVLTLAAVVYAQGYGGGGYDYSQPPTGSGLADQLKAAQTHATFAAQSDAMAGVRSHLVHVVNCLEGSRGANFNSREMNPCQGMGNGIIPDLTARGAAAAKALAAAREADTTALDALKLTDMARAKAGASKVADLLTAAMKDLPK